MHRGHKHSTPPRRNSRPTSTTASSTTRHSTPTESSTRYASPTLTRESTKSSSSHQTINIPQQRLHIPRYHNQQQHYRTNHQATTQNHTHNIRPKLYHQPHTKQDHPKSSSRHRPLRRNTTTQDKKNTGTTSNREITPTTLIQAQNRSHNSHLTTLSSLQTTRSHNTAPFHLHKHQHTTHPPGSMEATHGSGGPCRSVGDTAGGHMKTWAMGRVDGSGWHAGAVNNNNRRALAAGRQHDSTALGLSPHDLLPPVSCQ